MLRIEYSQEIEARPLGFPGLEISVMALEDEDARKWDGIDRKLSEVTAHTRIEKPKPICLMLRTNKALNSTYMNYAWTCRNN
jgi:hypothetical protein